MRVEFPSGVGYSRPAVYGLETFGLQNGEKEIDVGGGELGAGGVPGEGDRGVDGEDRAEDGSGVELARLAFVVILRAGGEPLRASIVGGGLEHPRLCGGQRTEPGERVKKGVEMGKNKGR